MITIPLSCADPVQAFRRLAGEPWAMLLDSAARHAKRGRHTIILARPFSTIEAVGDQTLVDGAPSPLDPFTALETALAAARDQMGPPPPGVPFAGGAAGVLGYGLGAHVERWRSRHPNPAGTPDMAMGLYDVAAVFDQIDRTAVLIAARPEAEARARDLAKIIDLAPLGVFPAPKPARWRAEMSRVSYFDRVERIREYIRAGDIYQANLTQRFLADRQSATGDFALYERLRADSPAPFAAFINAGERLRLMSASPERFIRLTADGVLETRPIKGTAPRVPKDRAADRAAAQALADSAKDCAENLMITDLLRNDLGRVAVIGSVEVPDLHKVESFTHVHHLVSTVTAKLRPDLGPVDVLRAAFPGGSITGAPKPRAMEIIDEIEVAARGPYCGSVAWIGFDGAMDSSIIIRSLVSTGEGLIAHAGGGIVADSTPPKEHAEMLLKVTALLRAADPKWSP